MARLKCANPNCNETIEEAGPTTLGRVTYLATPGDDSTECCSRSCAQIVILGRTPAPEHSAAA